MLIKHRFLAKYRDHGMYIMYFNENVDDPSTICKCISYEFLSKFRGMRSISYTSGNLFDIIVEFK